MKVMKGSVPKVGIPPFICVFEKLRCVSLFNSMRTSIFAHYLNKKLMKKNVLITLLAALLLSSCGEYNKLLKSTDYEYKYEAAKNYFAKGQYSRAATLLNELIAILKGTDKAEESLYMLGMSYYNQKDYQTAAQTFTPIL